MELPKTKLIRSIQRLKRDLEITLEGYQLHFPPVSSKRLSKWTKGRCHCVQDDVLFNVRTNYPSVNHLNLEEYSLAGRPAAPAVLYEEVVKHDPLLLDHSGERAEYYREDVPLSSTTLEAYSGIPVHLMTQEYMCVVLTSLSQQWDAGKFQRMLDYRLRARFSEFLSYSQREPCLELVMARCTDSDFVVDFFRKIGKRFQDHYDESYFAQLSCKHIHFFALHLKKTDHFSTVREQWLVSQDLLLTGFMRQNVQLVKLALEMHCPSVFLPSADSENNSLFPAEDYWPRKKIGLNPASFNSSDYYIRFTDTLFWATYDVGLRPGLIDCFRVIWRALPVPYLPLEDMRKCISRLLDEPTDRRALLQRKGGRLEAERLCLLFELFFKEDFPHVYKPRTLKHLSRYAVRRRCSLSERIADLPLPEPLKRYVDLEC